MSTHPNTVYASDSVAIMIREIGESVNAQLRAVRSELRAIGEKVGKRTTPSLHGVGVTPKVITAVIPRVKAPSLEAIHDVVVKTLDFRGDMKHRNNSRHMAHVRFLFAYVARKYGYSYPQIGLVIKRHHTTIMYGINQVNGWIRAEDQNGKDWAELVRKVEEQL